LVNNLIEYSKEALEKGDVNKAKSFAFKAVDIVHGEKLIFLKGASTERTEQQLADWFGVCSFLFNEVIQSFKHVFYYCLN